MAIAWTLARANGDTRTFEEWGIKSAIDSRLNLGRGTVELGFGRSDLLGGLPFDPDETLLIAADGAPYFRGRIIGEKRGALGSSETATITLADPWWYLEKIIYCRSVLSVTDPNANPVPADPAGLTITDFPLTAKFSSDIILSENNSGSLLDTRGMIVAVINYAIAKGAPIAIGTIDDGRIIPREQVHDATCADVILKCLRWLPDQTAWWDYSVNPPALNIRTRANRALLSLDVSDKAIRRVEINPRHDLVLTGVTISFLRRQQRTNFEFITLDQETAGPSPLGIGALVVTIELYGSYVYQAPASGGSTPPPAIIAQEAAPAGLALSLYNAYKDLSFDGRINFLATGIATLYASRTLRVVNGAPAWAAATMDIQQVTIDLFAMNDADGENYPVELSVGPPRHLGPTDLVGLTRRGRTNPPPQMGGSTTGGAPKLPVWNYGNPTPNANIHADVVLYFYFGQDVGFPNSWGGFDGDIADVYDVAGGALSFQVRAVDIGGAYLDSHGLRFARVNRYVPRTENLQAKLRNSGYLGSGSKPNVIVNRDSDPITIIG